MLIVVRVLLIHLVVIETSLRKYKTSIVIILTRMYIPILLLLLLLSYTSTTVILDPPHSIQVMYGSPATLHCRTSCSPSNISWYKNGSLVRMGEYDERFLILPDGSLFFLTTEPEDTGSYHCAVDTDISDTATLTVTAEQHDQDEEEINVDIIFVVHDNSYVTIASVTTNIRLQSYIGRN